jgi:hypothetical protein
MARFMQAIHAFLHGNAAKKDVDGLDQPGHDGG